MCCNHIYVKCIVKDNLTFNSDPTIEFNSTIQFNLPHGPRMRAAPCSARHSSDLSNRTESTNLITASD